MSSCGQTMVNSSENKITVCTKDECCCPDSIEIDIWDNSPPSGLLRIKPIKLTTENKFLVINTFNASKYIGFQKFKPEYVVRAYYVGNINPRVFEIYGSSIHEKMNPNALNWFDTGIKDFGKNYIMTNKECKRTPLNTVWRTYL